MINITIDGHSGCGKSATAKEVARQLNYLYLDTGAMYRAVTYALLQNSISLSDEEKVENLLRSITVSFVREGDAGEILTTLLNGVNVEKEIRSLQVSQGVSRVSAMPIVRKYLLEWQRKMANVKGVVMEGRDVGSVVLPDAELKIFMTADMEVRARRRLQQLIDNGDDANYDEVLQNLKERDRIDSSRKIAPLTVPNGAITIDTTHLTLKKQVADIVDIANQIENN